MQTLGTRNQSENTVYFDCFVPGGSIVFLDTTESWRVDQILSKIIVPTLFTFIVYVAYLFERKKSSKYFIVKLHKQ
jgi:hypothetical protein